MGNSLCDLPAAIKYNMINDNYVLYDVTRKFIWGLTDIGTAEQSSSQSDVTMPVCRVYAHVASDKRRL